jgi:glycosylphosphatidylinositol transamidase
LGEFFTASGLKVARQNFKYSSAGEIYGGQNLYAILHAPRGDATEAIVILAAWRNVEGELNKSGVALILTLARYFKSAWLSQVREALLTVDRMVALVKGHHLRNTSRE